MITKVNDEVNHILKTIGRRTITTITVNRLSSGSQTSSLLL
ncbi:hypothetical protein [Pontibacter korlensis]|nr:hypothetical protein [Pontibacter korlensis]